MTLAFERSSVNQAGAPAPAGNSYAVLTENSQIPAESWRDQPLREVAEGRWQVNPEHVPPGGANLCKPELYDAHWQHVGYGRIHGGSIELFRADGSRVGFGRGR